MGRATDSALRGLAAGVAVGAAALAAVATLAVAATAVHVARISITPTNKRVDDVEILEVGPGTVTLSATPDTRLPGTYGLWFSKDSGHAKIGEILSSTDSSVTRSLLEVDFGQLEDATSGRMSGWVYLDPGQLGVPFREVMVPTPLGPAPAWLVPAEQDTGRWLIGVHGRGVRRQECLRAVEATRRAGYTSLIVSWRNDGDAPRSSDGRYSLGDSEWEDVDAALRFAIEQGAKDVVLMGWSMGGAIALQLVSRSMHSAVVRGIVLESPVVDWHTTLQYQADEMGVPHRLRKIVLALIGRPWGRPFTGQHQSIDLDRLDFVRRAGELSVPILLLHSDDDGYVPPTASRELARARPDLVTYEVFTTARHIMLWNFDRRRWNAAIENWLRRLPATSARKGRPRHPPSTG